MIEKQNLSGHRKRLRRRFLADPESFSDAQLLELLLTYAIPRRDVTPLAQTLFDHFGAIDNVLAASYDDLLTVPGVGEQAAILITAVARLANKTPDKPGRSPVPVEQPASLKSEPVLEAPLSEDQSNSQELPMRTFTNDLSAVALEYLPQIARFNNLPDFQAFLEQTLPYNAINSRKRYARNLLSRYYPTNTIQTPLTWLFSYRPDLKTLKSALFYETVRAEPTVQFISENLIGPALPVGYVTRSQLGQRLEELFPAASKATHKRMVYSLLNLYTTMNEAHLEQDKLYFKLHAGTLAGFLYVLMAEFPQPGIYSFDALERGSLRHWLLWDREWMRRQLYNLRDFGLISKVSEIDAVRQFTLQFDRAATLKHYFEHPERDTLVLREQSATGIRNG